jgi:5'-nucleotidase
VIDTASFAIPRIKLENGRKMPRRRHARRRYLVDRSQRRKDTPAAGRFRAIRRVCFDRASGIRRRRTLRNRSQRVPERMRILCTNDDGIHAPGLKIVEEIARALSDDVWVVAPELDQSGVSHSLSLNDPLRLREVGPRHFAVRGTPTDCVIMGARHILGETMPDLVLSGVNKGRNVAEDVVYSGTIAGALEGTILGLPSFALSQEFSMETRNAPLWETALKFGPPILRKVLDAGVPKNTVINVNFPACAPEDVAGVRVTRQGKRNLGFLKVDQRRDGRGNPYFWIGFERLAQVDVPAEGTDLAALAARYVSVTPLRLDRTDDEFSEALTATLK